MNNVSIEGINSGANELIATIASCKASISKIKSEVESITSLASEINDYNGKLVTGSHKPVAQYNTRVENGIEKKSYSHTVHHWQEWKITGATDVIATKDQLISELSEIENSLDSLSVEVNNLYGSAEVIDKYITTIQNDLDNGKGLTQEQLKVNFYSSLRRKISFTDEDASNGQFISKDKILSDYWIDKSLKFEKQENGSYAIYQENDVGNMVLMGYTSASGALSYMSSVDRCLSKNKKEISNYSNTDSSNTSKTETSVSNYSDSYSKDVVQKANDKAKISNTSFEQSDNTKIASYEVSKDVKNEIAKYTKTVTTSRDKNMQAQAYSELSDYAKKIVDGKITVDDSMNFLVENGKDIVVPEGKNLYINGKKIIGDNMTFKYDTNTGKYRSVMSNGELSHGGYSKIEMDTGEIK